MTSTALIPVFTGTLQDQSVQLCNARDLHAFLQVGKDFSNWIKDRIATYGFIEGEDYSPNLANRSGGTAGKRRTDYHLTLDTAKELSMVENNDQGRMARRYFIAQEKLAQISQARPAAEPAAHHITASPIDLAALSRQVAEYLMDGQRDETLSIDRKALLEIEARLSKTITEFNSLPNSKIYSNVYNVLCMVKKCIKSSDSLKGSFGTLRLAAPNSNVTTAQSELVRFMRESALVCVEIGLYEIEAAAGHDAGQIRPNEIAKVTAKAMRSRPQHLADIQMVSGWMHAEAQCTDAQREGVRMHWLSIAQSIEDALS